MKGEAGGVSVIDDYAHHPEEIRVTLAAAKGLGERRLVALFQPHRYTRTRDLFEEFLSAFAQADILFITDGVSAEALCQSIVEKEDLEVHYVPNREHLVDEVLPLLRPGDIIMTLGAGNIWETSVAIVEALGKEST